MRSRKQFAAYPEDRVPEWLRVALAAPRSMRAEETRVPVAPVTRRTPGRRRRNDVCEMRLVSPAGLGPPMLVTGASGVGVHPASGVDGPLVIGLALLVCPPVGVTLLWASPRFSYSGQVAITWFAAFHAMVIAFVVVATAR